MATKDATLDTNIGLGVEQRGAIVRILNTLLSDEFLLYTKTRNFHWNVVGPHFHDLHKFMEGQYEQLAGIADSVAERARMLGGRANGSMAEFLAESRLKEAPKRPLTAKEMIANLLDDHEAVIRNLRTDLVTVADTHGDAGTNDFLTGLMETHEKMAWMLRATLE